MQTFRYDRNGNLYQWLFGHGFFAFELFGSSECERSCANSTLGIGKLAFWNQHMFVRMKRPLSNQGGGGEKRVAIIEGSGFNLSHA